MRPSKDLLQAIYCASSSRRACTLMLPSVVLSSFLRSLKVSDSLTASALTMPSRMRSWMSRSRSEALAACRPPTPWGPPVFSLERAFDLATVPPRDHQAEQNVKTAESRGHIRVGPGRRREQSTGAKEHEAEPHGRDDLHRERAGVGDGRAVEQQPGAGQHPGKARAVESNGQQEACNHGWRKAESEFPAGFGKQRNRRVAGFAADGPGGDTKRDQGLADPGGKPSVQARLARGQHGGNHRRDPHGHAAPSRYGRERRGALHRLADVPQVVHRPCVKSGWLIPRRTYQPH